MLYRQAGILLCRKAGGHIHVPKGAIFRLANGVRLLVSGLIQSRGFGSERAYQTARR